MEGEKGGREERGRERGEQKGEKEGGRKGGGREGNRKGERREGGKGERELETGKTLSSHSQKCVSCHVSLHHTNLIPLSVSSVHTQVCHIALTIKHQFSIIMALLHACT